jgi:SNF2 family DNA or RNA helicase
MRGPDDLQDYQNTAIWYLIENWFAALWLDLGLGKTVSALTALAWLLQMEEIRRVLVIAPLRVAISTWPAEIEAWSHLRKIAYTLIRARTSEPEVVEARRVSRAAARGLGLHPDVVRRIAERAATRAEERVRERLLRTDVPIHIISREMIPWIEKKWGKRWPYDLIVFDESSGLRDHSTERVRSMIRLRRKIKGLWELTGTPAPEGFIDLFPQIYLLDRGERFGSSITEFRRRYFDYNQYARRYTLKEGAADEIIRKIADLTLVMKARDYLSLNEPVFANRYVELEDSQMDRYQTLEAEAVVELVSGQEIVAVNAGALWNKLLQFASGSVYDDQRRTHWIHDNKIETLREVIEEAQGAPIIVAYWYQPTLTRLRKAFPEGRVMDKEGRLEKEWTAGTVPLMFLQPASGGHGLNLQYGGHYLVFFDIPASLEYHDQTVGRIARQGQTGIPTILYLIARGTLDEELVPLLRSKADLQEYLLRRLKRMRSVRAELAEAA